MKLFRLFKYWRDLEGYHKFVEETWKSLEVHGWGGYVLKEKLKLIKGHIKEWNRKHTKNLDGIIEEYKRKVNDLELKSEQSDLSKEEIITKREALTRLSSCGKRLG